MVSVLKGVIATLGIVLVLLVAPERHRWELARMAIQRADAVRPPGYDLETIGYLPPGSGCVRATTVGAYEWSLAYCPQRW